MKILRIATIPASLNVFSKDLLKELSQEGYEVVAVASPGPKMATIAEREGVPTIGDNVCVNANAIIIGNCNIGNNVLIAPGAFVNFNVQDNSIVIGNPGQIIKRETSPTEKYIVYAVC